MYKSTYTVLVDFILRAKVKYPFLSNTLFLYPLQERDICKQQQRKKL